MIKLQLIKTEGCSHCAQVKEILAKLKPEFPDLQVEEVLMTTEKGMNLVQKYSIMSSPGIIINDKLAFTGGATEVQIRQALKEVKKL
ncbi:MAG: thioredoxin family protein [Patescibacteria group bacterium]|nr:thioredoxin family protein [Patescibacteria group bacterium]